MRKMVVSNRFKELLAEKERKEGRKLPYRTIREETGISLTTLVRWANNEVVSFDKKVLEALCKFFGGTPGDLLVYEPLGKNSHGRP